MGAHPEFSALFEALRGLGFRRRASRIHTLDIGSEKLGWLGLNTASHKRPTGETLLHPVIGVRYQVVERYVAEGRGQPFHQYLPPTVSTPLLSLLPAGARSDWILGRGDGIDALVVGDVTDCLVRYAMPYISRQSDPRVMTATLEAKWAHWQDSAYRWPIALWTLGDTAEAVDALARVVASLGSRDDSAARELREYAERIRRQFRDRD